MSKISKEVSKGLGSAIKEAQSKLADNLDMQDNVVETLLNSGVETQKKRKRRTKAEIEAIKQEENSLFEVFEIKEEPKPKTHEEFCELELKKAIEKGLSEPEFDFRDYYEKGEIGYFVRYSKELGEKEICKVYLRTIYPRTMVGSEEKGCCHCIGYKQKDQIFKTSKEAQTFYDSLNIVSKYGSDKTKSKRKRDKDMDEEMEDENSKFEAYMNSEEDE